MEKNSSPKYLRVREVADHLGIGESTLWRWVKRGIFPGGLKLGPRVRVWSLAEVEAFVSAHEGANL